MLGYCQPLSRDSGLLLSGIHINLDLIDEEQLEDVAKLTQAVWQKLPSPWGVSTNPTLLLESSLDIARLGTVMSTFLKGLTEAKESTRLLWKGDVFCGATYEIFNPYSSLPAEVTAAKWNPLCTQGFAEYLLREDGDLQLIRRGFDPLFSLSFEP